MARRPSDKRVARLGEHSIKATRRPASLSTHHRAVALTVIDRGLSVVSLVALLVPPSLAFYSSCRSCAIRYGHPQARVRADGPCGEKVAFPVSKASKLTSVYAQGFANAVDFGGPRPRRLRKLTAFTAFAAWRMRPTYWTRSGSRGIMRQLRARDCVRRSITCYIHTREGGKQGDHPCVKVCSAPLLPPPS